MNRAELLEILSSNIKFFRKKKMWTQEKLAETPTQKNNARYQLYPTENTWTFFKLDTMTGRIWQVQYSIKGDEYRFETILNNVDIEEIFKIKIPLRNLPS